MFQVGQSYRFTMLEYLAEGIATGQQVWTVSEIDGPLLKLTSDAHRRTLILNSASSLFISAEPL